MENKNDGAFAFLDRRTYDFKNKTILVVEDNDPCFFLLKKFLETINVGFLRAENGLEAIDVCKANDQIDLVFMDIKMPEMDGYEATKQIKKFKSNLPITMLTGLRPSEHQKELLECGCDGYTSKPYDYSEIFNLIEKYI